MILPRDRAFALIIVSAALMGEQFGIAGPADAGIRRFPGASKERFLGFPSHDCFQSSRIS